jgi:hypothetical protein
MGDNEKASDLVLDEKTQSGFISWYKAKPKVTDLCQAMIRFATCFQT